MRTRLLLFFALVAPATALAIEAYRLQPGEKIVLDGKLDDAAWAKAKPWDKFYEMYPLEKVEETRVHTEARFAYDHQALYIAIKAQDPDMSQLRAPYARRDNVLSDQDMVDVFIDPVGTRKFAHFIRANPRGVIGDGLYNEDTSTEDFSPDFDVEVVTGRYEEGWTAEFRIPFSSLRYTDPPAAQWSVLVFRNWPRDQRYRIASSPLPRDQTCWLCLNEPLTGLVDLPPTRYLLAVPNVTMRTVQNRDAGVPDRRNNDFVASLDLKWRPRADVVFDATINPDFSQVELDTPQLSGNTQFALFFPEKRPFFLEGADILLSPYQAIYTRTVSDPGWGARVTQRNDRFDGAVLVTRDEGGGTVLLPNAYTTNSAVQDFKSLATFARGRLQVDGSTVGALFTDRLLDNGSYNRVFGPDIAWFPTTEHRLRAQVLGSWTTALYDGATFVKGDLQTSHAAQVDWQYNSTEWINYLRAEHVGRDFRADNGFIVQNGYHTVYSENSRKFVGLWGFNEVTPYFNAEYKTTLDGDILNQMTRPGVRIGLPHATTLTLELRPNDKVGAQPGGGILKRDQVDINIDTNPSAWFSRFYGEIAYGDRVDFANNRIGRGAAYSVIANLRPHQRAEVEYQMNGDYIDSMQPVDSGSSRILNERVQQLLVMWHFTARDSLRGIFQTSSIRRAASLWEQPANHYENTDTVSLVYGHRRTVNTTFYFGANFSRTRIPDAGVKSYQAEIFAKGSVAFEFL
ncbi:MAG TPA: sugar-binding protein [Usitatibacter sp.]|nr:sugar-binding protein [Usitatibacter sp.]